MSGHSKWSTIKRQKGVADAKRGKVFTKLTRAITVAAKTSPDPDSNPRLRIEVDRARAANMPKENIARAIAKAQGAGDGVQLEEVVYEAFGPGNVGLLIKTITDNRNRTATDVKNALTKNGGRLLEVNSIKWQFDSKGVIQTHLPDPKILEELELLLIEAGAQDINEVEDKLVIITPVSNFEKIKTLLTEKNLNAEYAEIELVSNSPVTVTDESIQQRLDNLKEVLDNIDDVDNIYTNEL